MRNVVAIALLVVFAWGCQPAELTPEKKQKVESLQNEIAKIENGIASQKRRSGFTSLDQSTAKLRWTVLLVMPPI